MSADRYAFRPVLADDMGMLARWLATPEVRAWWGDPDEQAAILRADLDEPLMIMRLVSFEGRPFAYIQDYGAHDWAQPHLVHLPAGARGVDTFIGDPEMMDCGHGSALIRARAEQLVREGAPLVLTDPDPQNHRGRQAYRKAGFRGEEMIATPEGPVIVMLFDGKF